MLMPISIPGGILFYYFVEAETYTDKDSPLTVSMAVGSSGAAVVLILVKARRLILSMFLHVEMVDLAAAACPP
ncbi:hypothetical protein ACFX2C_002489 [Malus domestica]